ncbi:hypothetical protein [Tropicimonas sp. IMCC6043]|uniref:hypothetical protein n=1 Tax=Tropicimonas sp. IMCC6043 TaxID=2510645 RepID=UPI00101D64BC|nr:hypothetical protein [Tropicimonas sp. IMCC6043]RYH10635.1 hypothetical protein EU800_07805 [Tropicimonas sp. IMCC6043]
MTNKNISVMCYDFWAISRFFRSCALAVATQQTTQIEWQTYKDSSVLNAVYSVLFWKEPPGTVAVKTATKAEIERRADDMHMDFMLNWIRILAEQGPQAAHSYVTRMERVRDVARDAVQELFREAHDINAEIAGVTNEAIRDLARIKLGAQVGVAVLGAVVGVGFVAAAAGGGTAGASLTILGVEAGAGGTAFGVAGAAHSVTHSVIKNWEAGPNAQVAGISMEAGKAVTSEVGGNIAGRSMEKALEGTVKSQQIIRSCEGQIRKYSERLTQEGLKKAARRKAQNIVGANTARVASEKAAIQGYGRTASNAARVGMTIPVLFAAWDVWDAVGDYNETLASLR